MQKCHHISLSLECEAPTCALWDSGVHLINVCPWICGRRENDHVPQKQSFEDFTWIQHCPKEYMFCVHEIVWWAVPPALGLSTPGLDHSASTLLIKTVVENFNAKAWNQTCHLFGNQGKLSLYSIIHLPGTKWHPESKHMQEHSGEGVLPAYPMTCMCIVKWGDIKLRIQQLLTSSALLLIGIYWWNSA